MTNEVLVNTILPGTLVNVRSAGVRLPDWGLVVHVGDEGRFSMFTHLFGVTYHNVSDVEEVLPKSDTTLELLDAVECIGLSQSRKYKYDYKRTGDPDVFDWMVMLPFYQNVLSTTPSSENFPVAPGDWVMVEMMRHDSFPHSYMAMGRLVSDQGVSARYVVEISAGANVRIEADKVFALR